MTIIMFESRRSRPAVLERGPRRGVIARGRVVSILPLAITLRRPKLARGVRRALERTQAREGNRMASHASARHSTWLEEARS